MRAAVVFCQDFDVLVFFAAVDLVLDAEVGELDGPVDDGQTVIARPGLNLSSVAIRPSVAVWTVAIALLEKLLVLPLEVRFEDDAADVGATFAKPLLGL